ncbi:MAG: MFS transporter [Phycisphaerales bacterium]|nr:MFS transporter [Phycisphaerales bacterium]
MDARTAPVPRKLQKIDASPARTLSAIAAMGMASGLGYLMINDALSAWLADSKCDVTSIGLFSLCALPYGLKFLWAPVLDFHSFPGLGWLGRRRSWLVASMLACAAFILILAAVGAAGELAQQLQFVGLVALTLALCSATLDIVVDAFRADAVTERSLGAGASLYVSGWRSSVVIAGAVVLMLPDRIGWPAAIASMAVLMLLPLAATLLTQEPTRGSAPATFADAVKLPLRDLSSRFGNSFITLVVFVLLYRLPDLFAGRMVMPFLMNELHFTKDEIGLLRQFGGAMVTIVGALLGGLLVRQLGVPRCLLIFGVLQAASNGGYLLLEQAGHNLWVFAGAIAVENFCNGLVASVFVAYLMSLCSPRASATQYAIFSGLMFGTAALLAAPTGYFVQSLGYQGFFLLSIALGLPGIALLPWVARLGETSKLR